MAAVGNQQNPAERLEAAEGVPASEVGDAFVKQFCKDTIKDTFNKSIPKGKVYFPSGLLNSSLNPTHYQLDGSYIVFVAWDQHFPCQLKAVFGKGMPPCPTCKSAECVQAKCWAEPRKVWDTDKVVYVCSRRYKCVHPGCPATFTGTNPGVLSAILQKNDQLLAPLRAYMEEYVLTHRSGITSAVASMFRHDVLTTGNFANIARTIQFTHNDRHTRQGNAYMASLAAAHSPGDIRGLLGSLPQPQPFPPAHQTPRGPYFTEIYLHHPLYIQTRQDLENLMRSRKGYYIKLDHCFKLCKRVRLLAGEQAFGALLVILNEHMEVLGWYACPSTSLKDMAPTLRALCERMMHLNEPDERGFKGLLAAYVDNYKVTSAELKAILTTDRPEGVKILQDSFHFIVNITDTADIRHPQYHPFRAAFSRAVLRPYPADLQRLHDSNPHLSPAELTELINDKCRKFIPEGQELWRGLAKVMDKFMNVPPDALHIKLFSDKTMPVFLDQKDIVLQNALTDPEPVERMYYMDAAKNYRSKRGSSDVENTNLMINNTITAPNHSGQLAHAILTDAFGMRNMLEGNSMGTLTVTDIRDLRAVWQGHVLGTSLGMPPTLDQPSIEYMKFLDMDYSFTSEKFGFSAACPNIHPPLPAASPADHTTGPPQGYADPELVASATAAEAASLRVAQLHAIADPVLVLEEHALHTAIVAATGVGMPTAAAAAGTAFAKSMPASASHGAPQAADAAANTSATSQGYNTTHPQLRLAAGVAGAAVVNGTSNPQQSGSAVAAASAAQAAHQPMGAGAAVPAAGTSQPVLGVDAATQAVTPPATAATSLQATSNHDATSTGTTHPPPVVPAPTSSTPPLGEGDAADCFQKLSEAEAARWRALQADLESTLAQQEQGGGRPAASLKISKALLAVKTLNLSAEYKLLLQRLQRHFNQTDSLALPGALPEIAAPPTAPPTSNATCALPPAPAAWAVAATSHIPQQYPVAAAAPTAGGGAAAAGGASAPSSSSTPNQHGSQRQLVSPALENLLHANRSTFSKRIQTIADAHAPITRTSERLFFFALVSQLGCDWHQVERQWNLLASAEVHPTSRRHLVAFHSTLMKQHLALLSTHTLEAQPSDKRAPHTLVEAQLPMTTPLEAYCFCDLLQVFGSHAWPSMAAFWNELVADLQQQVRSSDARPPIFIHYKSVAHLQQFYAHMTAVLQECLSNASAAVVPQVKRPSTAALPKGQLTMHSSLQRAASQATAVAGAAGAPSSGLPIALGAAPSTSSTAPAPAVVGQKRSRTADTGKERKTPGPKVGSHHSKPRTCNLCRLVHGIAASSLAEPPEIIVHQWQNCPNKELKCPKCSKEHGAIVLRANCKCGMDDGSE